MLFMWNYFCFIFCKTYTKFQNCSSFDKIKLCASIWSASLGIMCSGSGTTSSNASVSSSILFSCSSLLTATSATIEEYRSSTSSQVLVCFWRLRGSAVAVQPIAKCGRAYTAPQLSDNFTLILPQLATATPSATAVQMQRHLHWPSPAMPISG